MPYREDEEAEIRAFAQRLWDGQRWDKPEHKSFSALVDQYIAEIDIEHGKAPYCGACENRLCGVCGRCHMVDTEFVGFVRRCPGGVGHNSTDDPECTAWVFAYRFLDKARRAYGKQKL